MPALDPPPYRDDLLRNLDAAREDAGAVGLAVTLFDHGGVLVEAGLGARDREAALPVTPDTLFGVASVTKSFTALSVLLLASEGRLGIDDPVSRYLPLTLWDRDRPATLRHLMNQTSGLPPTPVMTWVRAASQAADEASAGPTLREALTTVSGGEAELAERAAAVSTFEGLVAWLNTSIELLAPPGELFSYSNDGFCLLGAVVEEVSGRPFDEFVKERVLAPLGMERSTFDLDTVLADPDHATLYLRDQEGAVRRSPAWETTGRFLGGGMLKSTLRDLRSYLRFLMAPGLPLSGAAGSRPAAEVLGVDPSLLAAMRTGVVTCSPAALYGFGLRCANLRGLPFVGHSGGLKGVASYVGWVPELGIGAVVLCNLGGVPVERLWSRTVAAHAGLPDDTAAYEPAPFAGPTGFVDDALGSYASGEPYGRLTLRRDQAGGLLAAVGAPAVTVQAFVVGPDEIALRHPGFTAPVEVLRRDGRVWAVRHGMRVLRRVGG